MTIVKEHLTFCLLTIHSIFPELGACMKYMWIHKLLHSASRLAGFLSTHTHTYMYTHTHTNDHSYLVSSATQIEPRTSKTSLASTRIQRTHCCGSTARKSRDSSSFSWDGVVPHKSPLVGCTCSNKDQLKYTSCVHAPISSLHVHQFSESELVHLYMIIFQVCVIYCTCEDKKREPHF